MHAKHASTRTALLTIALPILFSLLYLLFSEIAKPPTDLRPKVFVLGLSKTGTTSTGNALYMLGYRRLGWREIRSRHMVSSFINGDTNAIIPLTQYYDAFEDLPWPGMYQEMAELYPDAKFVLTLRKDDQTWLESLRRHLARGCWGPAEFWFGGVYVDGNEEAALAHYRNHTNSVRQFFADKPDRYTELVVDDGNDNWESLCRVAQCPQGRAPSVPFPKTNTVAHWRDDEFRGWFSRTRGRLMSKAENVISRLYYTRAYPLANAGLEILWHVITVVEMAITNIFYSATVSSRASLLSP